MQVCWTTISLDASSNCCVSSNVSLPESDGGRQSGVFAKVVPGCRVRWYPWQWAVWNILGERAAEGEGSERKRGGEWRKACVGVAGTVEPVGHTAVPQIHQHRPEPLLHPHNAHVRRHGWEDGAHVTANCHWFVSLSPSAPLSDAAPYELVRSRQLNAMLGPKGGPEAVDLICDLHNTTANMGLCLIAYSDHDWICLHIFRHLQASKSSSTNPSGATSCIPPPTPKSPPSPPKFKLLDPLVHPDLRQNVMDPFLVYSESWFNKMDPEGVFFFLFLVNCSPLKQPTNQWTAENRTHRGSSTSVHWFL